MILVPQDFKPLLDRLFGAFSWPQTVRRLILFVAAAIVVLGDRTVSSVTRLLGIIELVNPSTHHRLFSHRHWSSRRPARMIAQFIVDRFCSEGVLKVVGDETVEGHCGKKVYGSANFTTGGMGKNTETALLVSNQDGDGTQTLRQIHDWINEQFDQAKN